MRFNRRSLKRITAFAFILLMMVVLSACRTRLSNNSEVDSTMEDESGWMSENYEMRRSELGSPVAEPPIFSGTGSSDEDEYYDEYDDAFDGYDPDEEEDDEDEDEADTSGSNTTTTGTTSSGTSNVVRRRVVTGNPTSTNTKVPVTLNANGGKIKSGKKNVSSVTISIKKGSKYGSLSKPTRSGYDFSGWYTGQTSGTKVTSKTTLVSNYSHTLYAHWTKQTAKTYTVTLDYNDEDTASDTITVAEGGTYDLPTPSRQGYPFEGWFDADGNEIKSGDKMTATSNHTLTAAWGEYDPILYWTEENNTKAATVEKIAYYIDGGSTIEGTSNQSSFIKLVMASIGTSKTATKEYDHVVIYVDEWDTETGGEGAGADAAYAQAAAKYPDKSIILIHSGTTNPDDTTELLYRILVLEKMYPGILDKEDKDAEKAASELGGKADDISLIYYPADDPAADASE